MKPCQNDPFGPVAVLLHTKREDLRKRDAQSARLSFMSHLLGVKKKTKSDCPEACQILPVAVSDEIIILIPFAECQSALCEDNIAGY